MHIKIIASNQQSRSIPTNLTVLFPAQKVMPPLGTQALDVVTMDVACIETNDKFEHQSRRTRLESEAFGAGDIYSNIQPTSAPSMDKFLIRRCRIFVYVIFSMMAELRFTGAKGRYYYYQMVQTSQISKVEKRATRPARLS